MDDALSIRTLITTMGAVNLMLAVVMVTLSLTRRTYPGFHHWTAGFVLGGVGSVLIGLRDLAPDFLTIVVANTCLGALGLLLAHGLTRFLERPPILRLEFLAMVVLVAGLVWGTYVQPDLLLRTVLVMGIFGVFTARIAWLALKRVPELLGTPDWLVVTMGMGSLLAVTARVALALTTPAPEGFMEQSPAQAAVLLLLTLFNIGSMCSLVSLNSHRLELDLGISEDQLRTESAALEIANRELSNLAIRDSLTGLSNRRHFDQVLEAEWRRHSRSGASLSLIMIDIDFFKDYNDHYGHQAGDECLVAVAQAVRSGIRRPSDLVARYGGEEFAVVLPETDAEGARLVADQIAHTVRATPIPHAASSVSPFVTTSLGVATLIPEHGDKAEGLVELADTALYESKRTGRNRVSDFARNASH